MLNFKSISIFCVLLLVVLFGSSLYTEIASIWYFLIIVLWLVIITVGSFTMRWNFHLKAITSNQNSTSKKIAITFDDGPHPEYTTQIVELLDQFNAKGTFFCIGKHAELYPEIVKLISRSVNEIGNHSYSHSNFIDFSSKQKWLAELEQTDTIIENITSEKPTYFRPPFGVTTPKLAKALKTTNHKVIGWNIRSYDTALKNKDYVLKRIIKRIKPGAIILLHDTQPNSLYILEHLLLYLKQKNFQMVTVNDLLNEK